jgi:hypothetical protein
MRRWGRFIGYLGLAAIIGTIFSLSFTNPPRQPASLPPPKGTPPLTSRLESRWNELGAKLAPPINDLTFARRASLGLVGVVPSLEEIRWYEARPAGTRRADYVDRLLTDRRFADALAERLAAAWLPLRAGDNFVLYRPYRFIEWLADQIHVGVPYSTIVKKMLAEEGLWTDNPAVNFITAYAAKPEELAGQTAKNFLGLQIGCAQCHDHPFAPWKQNEFRGLAAHFARTDITFRGIDDTGETFRFGADKDSKGILVAARVPFGTPSPAADQPLRRQLADWITSPTQTRFREAIANRAWEMMLGKPITQPVDDLDGKCSIPGLLGDLAMSLQQNNDDLRSLFRQIALSEPFAVSSEFGLAVDADDSHDDAFATFPLTRLEPMQVARSLLQVSSIRTLDGDTGALRRVIGFFEKQDFLRFFQSESDDQSGTISQRLMLMNDKLVQDRIASELDSSSGRISSLAKSTEQAVELAFLICLTRRPLPEEVSLLAARIEKTPDGLRKSDLEDLFWGLINSSEFLLRH